MHKRNQALCVYHIYILNSCIYINKKIACSLFSQNIKTGFDVTKLTENIGMPQFTRINLL